MKKIIFATKGWKALQKDYISRDLHTLHVHKLHTFLQQNVSGYSFEEMIIHYGFISHAAMQASIAGYMQTGALENAESYFYLAARAKQTSEEIFLANPHKQPIEGHEVPLDCVTAATLSGYTSIAIDLIEATRKTLSSAPKQSNASRKDCQQNEQRNKRISLEIDFYENLLQSNYEQAFHLLPKLAELHQDASRLQILYTFFEQDNDHFLDALIQHMKEFRQNPYAGELNYFVLLMETLYQKRRSCELLDLADAPAALLELPECNSTLIEQKIGVTLPTFDVSSLLKVIDKSKIGPKFKQY